jgi:hypothetical protein
MWQPAQIDHTFLHGLVQNWMVNAEEKNTSKSNDLLTSQLVDLATLSSGTIVHTFKDRVTQCYFTLILGTQAPMRCQYL